MSQSPQFWEKTVEYAFVIEAARVRRIGFAAPLSGTAEHGAGDGIFGADDRLILVEFKVDKGKLATERSLFKDYEKAQLHMSQQDAHHFLIYAAATPVAGDPLPPLVAQTYFSGTSAKSAMDCFDRGIPPEAFKAYIGELLKLKRPDGRSSSGQITPESLASVVGVRADGSQASTVTLDGYVSHVFPTWAVVQAPQQGNQPGSHPKSGKF